MAAGMGSRFGGDKQLTGIGPSGEILLEYSAYDAVNAGFDKIVFVIRPGMEAYFIELAAKMKAAYPEKIFRYSFQGDKNSFDGIALPSGRVKPLGTVHAVLSAREHLDSHFAVINADDFYGRNSYTLLIEAMDCFDTEAEAALITYSLKNTTSLHGAVTRGICEIKDGKLRDIKEAYKVYIDKQGTIFELSDSGPTVLDPDSPVSMNMWAFSNAAIPLMEDYLDLFLDGLEADDNKSECILPVMIQQFIKNGRLQVTVYSTQCRWFGLTHRQDAEDVSWELDKRHQDGTYPDKLF